MTTNPVDDRASRLARINAALAERSLKPLAGLGDYTKGQIELIEIVEIFDHSKRFFTDVQFSCKFPNGTEGLYAIRWNAKSIESDGAVMIVLINGNLAVVRQYRPALCGFRTELPRGFGEFMARPNAGQLGSLKIADLPIATALRELGEDVIESAKVVTVSHLGNIAENSSTAAVEPAYWLIEITVDPELLRARRDADDAGLALQMWTFARAWRAIGTALRDNHTITGLALYRTFIERQENAQSADQLELVSAA